MDRVGVDSHFVCCGGRGVADVAFVREDQLLLKNKSLDGTILYLR